MSSEWDKLREKYGDRRSPNIQEMAEVWAEGDRLQEENRDLMKKWADCIEDLNESEKKLEAVRKAWVSWNLEGKTSRYEFEDKVREVLGE